ncbi:MAG: twin-arginine translocase subunit TatC [bacterium]
MSAQPMALTDHLSELRTRLLRSILWLALAAVIAWLAFQPLWDWLIAPYQDAVLKLDPTGQMPGLAVRTAQDGILAMFRVAIGGALIFASPLVLAECWGFVAPGLTDAERRVSGPVLPAAGLLFFVGAAFAYYILFPPMLWYLLMTSTKQLHLQLVVDVSQYLSLLINIMVALGAAFEIPVLTFMLAKIGLVTAAMLNKYRRHAIVGAAILGAIITPTPDAFNMMLMALPIYLLYECSVLVAWIAGPKATVNTRTPSGGLTPR